MTPNDIVHYLLKILQHKMFICSKIDIRLCLGFSFHTT